MRTILALLLFAAAAGCEDTSGEPELPRLAGEPCESEFDCDFGLTCVAWSSGPTLCSESCSSHDDCDSSTSTGECSNGLTLDQELDAIIAGESVPFGHCMPRASPGSGSGSSSGGSTGGPSPVFESICGAYHQCSAPCASGLVCIEEFGGCVPTFHENGGTGCAYSAYSRLNCEAQCSEAFCQVGTAIPNQCFCAC